MAVRSTLKGVLLVLFASLAAADVVHLNDGRKIEGKVTKATATEVVVQSAFGELTFKRSDVKEIVYEKSKQELYEEKLEACKTADDFYELGLWCRENKLRSRSKGCFEKAVELETDHAKARAELGHVRYKGEWMTPEERDARQAAEFEAEMKARGLVKWKEQWVTPEERGKLEQGLVHHDGRWMTYEEKMRLEGFRPFEGRWIPEGEWVARQGVERAEEVLGAPLALVVTEQAAVAGTYPLDILEKVAAGLDLGRTWFDSRWTVEPGIGLFGGRLAELYAFSDDLGFKKTVPHFAAQTTTVPEGWADAVQKAHGFVYWDPYPVSSCRLWGRAVLDVEGHCYHHWGHILVNSLDYDGRLLPPWYDEAVSALTEYGIHEKNRVFCRSRLLSTTGGTSAGRTEGAFDKRSMRAGEWMYQLKGELEAGRVMNFDRLAQLEFHNMELVDIAAGMAIVEWIATHGDGALRKFHKELRKGAPEAPVRVIQNGNERHAVYDAAFQAATGVPWRKADQEWRKWFLSR